MDLNQQKTAPQFDNDSVSSNPPRGAGDRLGRILEETKPRWMGRRKSVPGDVEQVRVQRDDIARMRAALIEALALVDGMAQ